MRFTTFSSPLGELLLAGDDMGLRRLSFLDGPHPETIEESWRRDDGALGEARDQVLAYLDGRRRSFGVDVAPEGNDFQREVWAALVRIPYGETRTYGELAKRIGHDRAASAISAANNANPLPLLIPCHRVVAADGLGSYSAGETIKQKLLALEDAHPQDGPSKPGG